MSDDTAMRVTLRKTSDARLKGSRSTRPPTREHYEPHPRKHCAECRRYLEPAHAHRLTYILYFSCRRRVPRLRGTVAKSGGPRGSHDLRWVSYELVKKRDFRFHRTATAAEAQPSSLWILKEPGERVKREESGGDRVALLRSCWGLLKDHLSRGASGNLYPLLTHSSQLDSSPDTAKPGLGSRAMDWLFCRIAATTLTLALLLAFFAPTSKYFSALRCIVSLARLLLSH